jgi:flagellar basal-body rod modification protein FlgD
LEPTSNQEFLGQLAQFSTLSAMETMNAKFGDLLSLQQITPGSNLIGRHVAYMDSNNQAATGTVQSVVLNDGKVQLQVNGGMITLDKVLEVAA